MTLWGAAAHVLKAPPILARQPSSRRLTSLKRSAPRWRLGDHTSRRLSKDVAEALRIAGIKALQRSAMTAVPSAESGLPSKICARPPRLFDSYKSSMMPVPPSGDRRTAD